MTDWSAMARAARHQGSDPALDFCLWPYEHPHAPRATALQSEALLYESFAVTGMGPEMAGITTSLRDAFGPFRTVWGMKWDGTSPSWEFYFYDYERGGRRHGIADFLAATRGLIACDLRPDDSIGYFMFSVEITPEIARGAPLEQIDIYMGNPGSNVSSGICYGQTAAGLEMRNFYFFFDTLREAQAIDEKLTESIHLPIAKLSRDALLWPDIHPQVTVVANKRQRDGLYFSRIGVDEMLLFLDRLKFPAGLRDFARQNRDDLAHLLYDAGWDFDCDSAGSVTPVKGSIYGIL